MNQNKKNKTPGAAPPPHSPQIPQILFNAIDSGTDTVLLTDAKGEIIYANPSMLKRCGYVKDKLSGRSMMSLWFQPNAATRHILAEVAERMSWQGQIPWKKRGGGFFQETCTINQVLNDEGSVSHLIKIGKISKEGAGKTIESGHADFKYIDILNQMSDGYLETDLKGNITFINKRTAQIFQRTLNDLIGKSLSDYMTQEGAEKTRKIYNTVYRTGKSDQITGYEVICPNGDLIFCETIINLLYDQNGTPIGFGGIIRDVTEQERLARQLKESEDSYRRVLELAPDAITISRMSDGKYFEVNEAFCQQTGYARHEVLGRTVEELRLYKNPRDRERIVQALRTEKKVSGERVDFRHRDGSTLYDIISGRIIEFKGEKCILFVATLINSIVETQAALQESEKRYRSILEAAPDAICLTNLSDGTYIEANDMFYKRTGFTPQETIGRTSIDLNIYAEKRDRERFISLLRKKGHVHNMEILTRYKNGSLSHQLWSGRILEWDGRACALVVAKVIDEEKKTQQLLHEREESYRTILNTAPYGIVITRSSDEKYVLVNEAFCKGTGFTRKEAIGRTPDDLAIYADRKQRQKIFERLEQDKRIFGLEVSFRSKKGKVLENLISVSPIVHRGEPCFLTVTVDISDQKDAKRRLEKSEESYRAIIESAPYSIDILSIPDLRYVAVNATFCQNTGYARDEIIGRNASELGLFKNQRQIEELVNRLREDKKVEGMELKSLTKDGQELVTLCYMTPVRYMGEKCYLSSNVNLTPLKNLQSALHESETRFQAIFETAADAIFVTDPRTGRFLDINRTACRHLGYTENELKNMFLENVVHPAHPYQSPVLTNPETPLKQVFFESLHIGKDGKEIPVEVSSAKMMQAQKQTVLSIVRDVSERKKAENELYQYRQHLEEMVRERTRELEKAQNELVKKERLAVLGQLTATVSHELRNPLGVIRSSNFFLKRKINTQDAKISKHLNRIDEQVSLCDIIVADLLEYTRGRQAAIERQRLQPWIRQVVDQIRESETIDIKLIISDELPPIPHDRDKMRRVLINLLNNSVQAVRSREKEMAHKEQPYKPVISLTVSQGSAEICFKVKDNGSGMDERTKARAFEPLFTTRARGTGIGLAIVKKIILEHGGRIELDTAKNEGSLMVVALPKESMRKGSQ